MTPPIARFDHVMIAVQDLERAAASFRSLGFRLTPKGIHEGKGTANYCIMFAESYIELIGVVDPAQASGRLGDRISQTGEGVIGLAYGGDNADAIYGALTAAGIAAEPPNALARPLELDGERHMVKFSNIMLPGAGLEPLIQFVCTHLTPDLTRARHEWRLHANCITGINEIIIAVQDPTAHVNAMQRMFGKSTVRERKGDVSALVEPLTIRLTTWAGVKARFPKAADEPPKVMPHVAALCVDVTEPDAATTMWDMAKIAHHEGIGGAVYVSSTDAHGVIIEVSEG